MALEELEKLSRKQIRTKINECFQQAESRGVEERSGHLAEAEFFMRELEHRRDSGVSIRDFVLEIVVIAPNREVYRIPKEKTLFDVLEPEYRQHGQNEFETTVMIFFKDANKTKFRILCTLGVFHNIHARIGIKVVRYSVEPTEWQLPK